MPRLSTRRVYVRAVALLCCTALMDGCASWQGPRIDPSGQRLFIWPNETPPPTVVAPPGVAPAVVAPPPGAPLSPPPVVVPPVVTAPLGNLQAPPVYSDPPMPPIVPAPAAAPPVISPPPPPTINSPAPPIITTPATPAAAVSAMMPITPVVPVGTPNIVTSLGAVAPAGVDHLRVTPGGVLAPVGSEVVLRAGICGADGYLHTNQQVQWSLYGSTAGQFGALGAREPLYSSGWWSAPRLVDACNATGWTTHSTVRLTRGTPDPSDDVEIPSGDAWVTVTATAEGTSFVTAYTPSINTWNRAVATIHWVDAQWTFPPSAVVEAGRPHVLTTTIMRKTNNVPLAGWIVRYDAARGASLGYEGGSSVQVPTDANGRASVEVSPMGPGGGTATVGVTVMRPATGGGGLQFEAGRGNVTVSWAAGASPVPPISMPAQPAPFPPASSPYDSSPASPPPPLSSAQPGPLPSLPSSPPPSAPSGPPPSDPYTPPAGEPVAGRPQLELRLTRAGAEQVGIGEFAGFEVTITNRGTATARRVRVRDRFDVGLRHPSAKPNETTVEYAGVPDLSPGESKTIPLTFQVVAGGTHCHEVTVTAEGADSVSERACVNARQAALEVTVTAPRTRVVGEIAQFNVVVKNVGEVAATNVELVNRYDGPLEPSEAPEGHERLADGGILLRIDRLEAGERRTLSTTAVCRTPSNRACNRATIAVEGSIVSAAEGCVEILPALPAGPGGAAQVAPLRLTITESSVRTRVGQRQMIYLNVENTGQQIERQVQVRVLLPQELTTDAAQIQPQQGLTVLGQELRFAVDELSAQQPLRITIPVTANRAGSVQIRAAAASSGMPTPIAVDSNLIEILSASL